MKKSNIMNLITGVTVAIVTISLTGCASGNYQQGSKTGAGLTEAADKISSGEGKIDATLAALNDLVNSSQGDLEIKYKKFNDSVSDLESTANNVKDRVADMRKQGDKYLKAWDEQLATIKNEDIKNRSSQRKAEVQQKFTDIKRSYAEAGMLFKPFMSDLKDIQTALGTDLTVGGVSAIKGAADKANQDAGPLKNSVAQVVADFKALGVAMSSSAPPAQPQ